MKVAVMQPYFFPYIGYWQLINMVDIFVIFDDVNYIKKGYINRNYILVNKKRHLLTLELKKMSQNRLIKELEVGDNREKLLKTIYFSYKKAPYFNDVYPLLKAAFACKEKNLARFIGHSIKLILNYLDIKTELLYSSDIKIDVELKRESKIISICKYLNATHYINASGGRKIYDDTVFNKNNLEISFLPITDIKYKQFDNVFIPNLSIIDLMMFNTKKSIKSYINISLN